METDPLPELAEDYPAPKSWAGCEFVTLEEAVMLSLGIDPEILDNFEPAIEWNDDEGEFEVETPHFGQHHQQYHIRKNALVTALRQGLIRNEAAPKKQIIIKLEEFVKLGVRLKWPLPKWLSRGYGQRGAPQRPNPTTTEKNALLIAIAHEVIREHPTKNKADLSRIIASRFNDRYKDREEQNSETVRNILFNVANAPFKNYRPNSESSE